MQDLFQRLGKNQFCVNFPDLYPIIDWWIIGPKFLPGPEIPWIDFSGVCSLLILILINDHCGINQNAAGWLFYFQWWKEISLSQKVESADFWVRFLLRRNLRWIFAERKLFFTWFFDDIDKMMMRLSLMKMTHTSFAYSLFSFNILLHLLVVAKLSKFSENQKIDLQ